MKKKVLAALLAVVMILGSVAMAAGGGINVSVIPMKLSINGEEVTPVNAAGEEIEIFSYKDATYVPLRYLAELLGIKVDWDANDPNTAKLVDFAETYTGTATGMQGPVTVTLKVKSGKIVDAEVTSSRETAGVADEAIARIPKLIVEHQTTTLDAVTGATLASRAVMNAATEAAKAAGLDMDALKANAYHPTAGEDETWNTEVLVIGGGGAGLSAAISAAQNGAKVILIEKAGVLGGNTFHAGGAFNAVDPGAQASMNLPQALKDTLDGYLELTPESPELHFDLFPEWIPILEALQAEIKEFYAANEGKTIRPIDETEVDTEKYMPGFDSINLHMWHIFTGGLREMTDGTWTASNIDLARSLAENALDAYQWAGSIGVPVSWGEGTQLSTVLGAMWPRTHSYSAGLPLINALKAAAEKEGVVIYTETRGTELLTKGGQVVGAKAEKADGTKITINAKGVVLASGGYCANPVMVKEYDTYWGDDLTTRTLTTNAGTNTGDGLKMAMAIGADTVDLGVTQMMPSSSATRGTMTHGMWAGAETQLWIGAEGKRIVNEYAERDVLAKAGLAQPDGIFYIICAGFGARATGLPAMFGAMYPNDMWYGSTLAELAEATKTPVGGATSSFTEEQLRAVIEQYNSYVEAQHDPDFGKEMLSGYIDLEAIESNPAVGICISPRKPSLHHSMGGVVINTNCEVLNTEGSVIPGLWAAGEVTGGIHAGNRLGGNAVADIFTHGRIAGRNVAEKQCATAMTFTPGTYTAKAAGYNADVTLAVTFNKVAITDIEIVSQRETEHVGDVAFDIMFADAKAAIGSGIDSVAGATFTSFAIKAILNDAAEQAGCSDLAAFKKNTVVHEAGDEITGEWDVVVVGAGGAGMAAAAQAAQNGATVLVIEKAVEMGGNTLVAGGAFQLCRSYLVWDAKNPEATTGVCPEDGKTYDKVKSDAGRIDTLKIIADWSEEPFDGTVDAEHPFVAGDIKLNAVRGVHAEYLPTLKTLKEQINEYVTWAEEKIKAGSKETELPVFSTEELHIFQTYYGGLRPDADGKEWIYGDFDLVSQFIKGGQDMSKWLMDQGSKVALNTQNTLIGCLWQRTNAPLGGTVNGVEYESKWGSYFKVPENTVLKANAANKIMTRTTAKELIVENGKVVGVKAEMYDGTPVTVKANKGVILATGGYAANIKMVQETNEYWKPEYIANNIGTTNRSGMTGDGITMGQAVGADVTGMGWTQMMPLGWVDNGNLSRGAGEPVIFINAATGKRYVDESAERDVLSLGGFENGMSMELAKELGLKQVPGIYVELSNPVTNTMTSGPDVIGRQFTCTVDELAAKLHLDKQVLVDTITEYDNYVMGVSDKLTVPKMAVRGTIGDCEKDDKGNYKPETYKLDKIFVRYQAPSTHHTMGGLKVDTERHVLDTDGNIIDGLWAAGEVCGGFMAGNRLGGNATTEIIVSGRIAANSVTAAQ